MVALIVSSQAAKHRVVSALDTPSLQVTETVPSYMLFKKDAQLTFSTEPWRLVSEAFAVPLQGP